MRLIAPLLFAALLPLPALAAGSDDTEPPAPSETTTICENGQVWDAQAAACVNPEDARLDDDTRFRAVRELAWAGRPLEARRVLAAMTEGETDRVMTYQGFTLRKSGQIEAGLRAYEAALTRNPGNVLARSYYGQALVEQGETEMARVQLAAIRAHGGAGSWAETALARAIDTGLTSGW